MKIKILTGLVVSAIVLTAITFCAPLMSQEVIEDDHYIQSDEYFISEEKFSLPWKSVFLAKMITPATKETKNQAKFMVISTGKERWTGFYYKTGILAENDIKVGLDVICHDASDEDGVYRAPENKDEAKSNSWFMARITDVSDKYKGYITVSGGYKIRLNNMRVVVK